MDVTPNDPMFAAMKAFVDSLYGPEPAKLDVSPGAIRVRQHRMLAFDFLHHLVAISMREGVNRAIIEARKRKAGVLERPDAEDKAARDKAVDDAQAGAQIIQLR